MSPRRLVVKAIDLSTERSIQREVIRFYRRLGCYVYPTSQNRASRVALGLPDLYVMHPIVGPFWHEVKRPGGKQTREQENFETVCKVVGIDYVLGGMDEARAQLVRYGVIVEQPKGAA